MTVGILLVTHDDIGASLLFSLEQMFGNSLPMPVKNLPIRQDYNPLTFCYHAEEVCASIDQGDGVLVLTDLFGATPCNIACSLIQTYRVRIVAGVNFPMLVKIMSYPTTDLDTLANKALSGGCQGVVDVNKHLNPV